MLKALVVDDELFAREELIELLTETGEVEIIGQASNAIEGLETDQPSQAGCGCIWISKCLKLLGLNY